MSDLLAAVSDPFVRVEEHDGVATVRLDHPPLNARRSCSSMTSPAPRRR